MVAATLVLPEQVPVPDSPLALEFAVSRLLWVFVEGAAEPPDRDWARLVLRDVSSSDLRESEPSDCSVDWPFALALDSAKVEMSEVAVTLTSSAPVKLR